MNSVALLQWLQELRAGLAGPGPAVTLRLRLVVASDGTVRFAAPGEAAGVQEVEMSAGGAPTPPAAPSSRPVAAKAVAPPEAPLAEANEATLRRRLEMVLGGPPGFTTGARAEVLADLLREFGRERLRHELQGAWASQFDTGLSASAGG
ncbi:MAG: hypothetical protein ACKVYV_08020 [Limisphaerales bacterium]